MKKVWHWFQERAESTHAQAWLFAVSFSESSFFLIPPDILLLAMISAGAVRWVWLATLTSIASVLGAVFGYLLGLFVFAPVVNPLISLYGLTESFAHVGVLYEQSVFLSVLTAAFTPIPFKVFVLAGGFFRVSFLPFILASVVGRSTRFFLVAWIAKKYGARVAEHFLEKFKWWTYAILFVIAVVFAVAFFRGTL
jgi:membrane protein YqaA with SNARE-associated domain